MHNKRFLYNIYVFFFLFVFLFICFLLFAGSKHRVGYLSDLSLNVDKTLELNNINSNSFYSNIVDTNNISSLIFSNSSINRYAYHYKLFYYSKLFRNSDIYGVYIDSNNIPSFIDSLLVNDDSGTPFGNIIVSSNISFSKVDNIFYTLKLRGNFLFYLLLFFLILFFLVFFRSTLYSFFLEVFFPFIFHIFLKLRSIGLKPLFVLFCFLCILLLPRLIHIIKYKPYTFSSLENRVLSSRVSIFNTDLSSFPKKYEKYFNDHLPFRYDLIRLKNLIDYYLFKDLVNKRLLLGIDKWLFLRDSELMYKYIGLDRFYLSESELDDLKNILLSFRDKLKKDNIDFILMICPDKQFIYGNYLPDYVRLQSSYNYIDQFVDYISTNTDIKISYLKPEFLKYKDKYQLYYRYDAHWNALGAYIGYQTLMRDIGVDFIPIEDRNILQFDYSYRTNVIFYDDMIGLTGFSTIKDFQDDPIYVVENYVKYNVDDAIHTNINDSLNKKIYIIRDSFMQSMAQYVVPTFYTSEFIHIRNFKYSKLTNNKPDIVVFQSVERLLFSSILNSMKYY